MSHFLYLIPGSDNIHQFGICYVQEIVIELEGERDGGRERERERERGNSNGIGNDNHMILFLLKIWLHSLQSTFAEVTLLMYDQ